MGSFKEQLDSDLDDVFFKSGEDVDGNDVSEFAESFIYRPSGLVGSQYEISGIVDATTEEAQPQGNGYARVQTKFIRVLVKEASVVGGVQKTDTVIVREQEYSIPEVNSDGVGVLTLILHKK